MKTKAGVKLILMAFFVTLYCIADAQVVKTRDKEYKRAAKQRTKQLTKEGYSPKGAGSVELYVKEAINKEFEKDENGDTKNPVVYTSAVDPTFEGAVSACRAAARAALQR